MNTSFVPKALPSLPLLQSKAPFISTKASSQEKSHKSSIQKLKASKCINLKAIESLASSKSLLAIQVGALIATVGAEPVLAVTGVNNEEDLVSVLIQLAISAFFYFLVAPPIIMTWLRKRWYKRDLLEMYLQFMFVFIFFPGLLLWAPFLNFRKFPRDPSMKYPWSTPENPSQIKNTYRKYPWATEEDYEVQ
ncbi:NAD(P)H-quinone oxidoreductase subunit L, chloroplastic [Nicotiana tomentosiformis]|uniref:NAD(P)H-quinone oxidoreductase subunit L, chloroplastic n=1 Tax=Nicotiana tomentosiformis TaxID=4098 RepID=UPI00051B4026|nr:NAD(P)H-quinone oxidoreductase subunit L, chloroplastic [Nicotiana tomentosiformis]